MSHSRRLYDNLPEIVRMGDETGLVAHLLDQGIQPVLDRIHRHLEYQSEFYDPSHPLAYNHLEWLGLMVGLEFLDGHYLGVGINPNWTITQKQYAIAEAMNYWRSKGTLLGVRKAIRIWMGWEAAGDTGRLRIFDPTGQGVPRIGDLRWRYDTALSPQSLKTFFERPRLGSGDELPGRAVVHQNRVGGGGVRQVSTSRIGKGNSWMVFEFNEGQIDEWNTIFPDQLTLNHEIIPLRTVATAFAWLSLEKEIVVNWQNQSDLHDTSRWEIRIQTDRRTYSVPALSFYWENNGTKQRFSQATSVEGGEMGDLLVEFAFIAEPDDLQINSLTIDLGNNVRLLTQSFPRGLRVDRRMVAGFRLRLGALWENTPFTDQAVRMEFAPPSLVVSEVLSFPVSLLTDGQEVVWDQTEGATCTIIPNNAKTISVTIPSSGGNTSDVPYKIRATATKRFRNGQTATRQKIFTFYSVST